MLITEGTYVLIRNEHRYKFLKISSEKKVNFNGRTFSLKNAIDVPFGSTFSILGDQVHAVKYKSIFDTESSSHENNVDEIELKDNRNIKGSPGNQKLSGSSIEELRRNGVSGQDILDQLIEGSATFEQKTQFSQQKYLKKKKNRHLSLFSIERPHARMFFEIYNNVRPEKCLGLRFETVCRILSYANIQAGSTVLLCENCSGLITVAALERIGIDQSEGSIIQFYHGSSFPQSEFSPAYKNVYTKKVHSVRLLDVMPILLYKATIDNKHNTKINHVNSDGSEIEAKICKIDDISSEKDDQTEIDQDVSNQFNANKHYTSSFNQIFGKDQPTPDSLIIATRFHPVDLTLLLLQFLPIGRPFVVYTQYIQPLVDLYNALKRRNGITHLRLTDSWFRHIQVLPERTHPEINMSCSNGYLLTGYTVEPALTVKELLESGLLSSVG
ncbi:tRNA (adenine(58)-N(1))-methyltransferase non-catalytic subunit TRM6 [Schistosoma japonicum]|uniref:tRNA (adenine(58)-N(1))-methyltransferase non-catalytic subunit TRM6 n=1 Tax=Schistosoma japonicum TaxID=6182 RepID=A0A4Z2DW44_SCHJA|nr:tRNA (adenine(58)-N(1))-methyltransferase non-catalytic subunit TRM6 [Schistosoma japonicum]